MPMIGAYPAPPWNGRSSRALSVATRPSGYKYTPRRIVIGSRCDAGTTTWYPKTRRRPQLRLALLCAWQAVRAAQSFPSSTMTCPRSSIPMRPPLLTAVAH